MDDAQHYAQFHREIGVDWRLILEPPDDSRLPQLYLTHENVFESAVDNARLFARAVAKDKPFSVFVLTNEHNQPITVDGQEIMRGQSAEVWTGIEVVINGIRYRADVRAPTLPQKSLDDLNKYRIWLKTSPRFPWTGHAMALGQRADQEDYIGYHIVSADDPANLSALWVVADGVGGESHGEIASQFVVQYLLYYYFNSRIAGETSAVRLKRLIMEANAHLVEYGRELTEAQPRRERQKTRIRVATTVSAVALHQGQWSVAHVGNSPIYLFQDKQLHNLFSLNHQTQAKLLRYAVGRPEEDGCHVDVFTMPAQMFDILLLCTDGLTISDGSITALTHADLAMTFEQIGKSNTSEAVEKTPDDLTQQALRKGADDNMSVVVVRLLPTAPSQSAEAEARIQIGLQEPTLPELPGRRGLFNLFR